MLGVLIGLTPEFSLALSLATRIRELIVDLADLELKKRIKQNK